MWTTSEKRGQRYGRVDKKFQSTSLNCPLQSLVVRSTKGDHNKNGDDGEGGREKRRERGGGRERDDNDDDDDNDEEDEDNRGDEDGVRGEPEKERGRD